MPFDVYLDSDCFEEADFAFVDYQNYAATSITATAFDGAFNTWNTGLDAYKTCQPCRAYNRRATYWSGDRRHRVTEYGGGQGSEEKKGYN